MDKQKRMQWLADRKLPALYSDSPDTTGDRDGSEVRRTWLDAFEAGEYGRFPAAPVGFEIREHKRVKGAFGGKATHLWYRLACTTPGGRFSFPFQLVLPDGTDPVPVFVHASFYSDLPNPYCPVVDLIDRGFGLASYLYTDIVPDRADGLDEGLAGRYGAASRDGEGSGTIGYWAWAAQRIADFLLVHPRVDKERLAVMGHSRLGKTALWAGAMDGRFSFVVSTQSGCSGAAITRGKQGERVENITRVFPHWFCPEYARHANREEDMPFEQHQLLAAIAPRLLYVCSAAEDNWADPASEFLSCVAASEAWERQGLPGLVTGDELPQAGTVLQEGTIGYHLRAGGHALQPEDWKLIMDFWARHMR